MFTGRIWRDDRFDPPQREFLAQASGIIGSVGDYAFRPMTHGEQAAASVQVVNVPGRDQQSMWASNIVGQRVDFGRLSPTRAADGVVEGPPFAPDAERWALM